MGPVLVIWLSGFPFSVHMLFKVKWFLNVWIKSKKQMLLHSFLWLTKLRCILVSTRILQSHGDRWLHSGIGISVGIHYRRFPLHSGPHSASLCIQDCKYRLQWWGYTAHHSGTDNGYCSGDPSGYCHKLRGRWREITQILFISFDSLHRS